MDDLEYQQKVIDMVQDSMSPVPGDAGYDPSVFAKNQVIRNKTVEERLAALEKEVKDLRFEIAIERNRRR